jgi:hypothetical protein
LRPVSERVFTLRAGLVLRALLDETPLSVAAAVVGDVGQPLQAMLLRRLPPVWQDERSWDAASDRRGAAAVALAYLAANAKTCTAERALRFEDAVKVWVRRSDPAQRRQVVELLNTVDADDAEYWGSWARRIASGRARTEPAERPDNDSDTPADKGAKVSRWLPGKRRGRR